MEANEWNKGDYLVSTDRSKIDLEVVHSFLAQSYWAENIPVTVVRKSIENSLCFGMYRHQSMIGFARVITDLSTFAYLADVFILPVERGKGLAKWLVQLILDYPDLQGLRRFILATRDAHSLYSEFGFTIFDKPERWMQRHQPDVYKKTN